jgi:hypothetical protein
VPQERSFMLANEYLRVRSDVPRRTLRQMASVSGEQATAGRSCEEASHRHSLTERMAPNDAALDGCARSARVCKSGTRARQLGKSGAPDGWARVARAPDGWARAADKLDGTEHACTTRGSSG